MYKIEFVICLILISSLGAAEELSASPRSPGLAAWQMHVIDNSAVGADGVRLLDVNRDGWPDIATGWEEAGLVKAYLNPGPEKAGFPWPALQVGRVGSVEDAVFADLDADGAIDLISACEGDCRGIHIHWAPPDPENYLNPSAWQTAVLPASLGLSQWMFSLPWPEESGVGLRILAGAKNEGAAIGFFRPPVDKPADKPVDKAVRSLSNWSWQEISPAGWVMSLLSADMDGDGDLDVLTCEEFEGLGVIWYENPLR